MNDQKDVDLKHALSLSTLALIAAREAAIARVDPAIAADVRAKLADGSCQLALLVLTDGRATHVELALVDAGVPTVFSQSIIAFDGAAACALAPADAVAVVDRQSMN
jgi:hypothetical protein